MCVCVWPFFRGFTEPFPDICTPSHKGSVIGDILDVCRPVNVPFHAVMCPQMLISQINAHIHSGYRHVTRLRTPRLSECNNVSRLVTGERGTESLYWNICPKCSLLGTCVLYQYKFKLIKQTDAPLHVSVAQSATFLVQANLSWAGGCSFSHLCSTSVRWQPLTEHNLSPHAHPCCFLSSFHVIHRFGPTPIPRSLEYRRHHHPSKHDIDTSDLEVELP